MKAFNLVSEAVNMINKGTMMKINEKAITKSDTVGKFLNSVNTQEGIKKLNETMFTGNKLDKTMIRSKIDFKDMINKTSFM